MGGSYGGSQRALELYLLHSDRDRFVHEVLFYFPTPRMERLRPLAEKVLTLNEAGPPSAQQRAGSMRDWVKQSLRAAGLASRFDHLRAWTTMVSGLPAVNRLNRIFRAGSYDVIHVNNTPTYQPLTVLAAKRARVRTVAHIRNPLPNNALSRWLLGYVDFVVTVNRTLEKDLCSWGIPVDIRTRYDGVELPSPDAFASRVLRASLVPPGATLVGSLGRLEEQKGYQCLIYAAARVIQQRPDVRFAIAGEGSLRSSLQRLIDELGLASRFHLCGFKADVANFIAALDIFVSSSLWEGLPLAMLEAMLQGKPMIATDVGGISEFVLPGQTGELVPPSDPSALTTALLRLLNQREQAVRTAGQARELARACTNPITNARALDEIIERTVRKHG